MQHDNDQQQGHEAAGERNVVSAYRELAQALGAEWHQEGGLTWFFSSSRHSLGNGVLTTFAPVEGINERISQILHQAQSRTCALTWLIGPSTRPSDLSEHLQRHGCLSGETVTGMTLDLQAMPEVQPPLADLVFQTVETGEQMALWLEVLCRGFGFPEEVREVFFDLYARYGFVPRPHRHFYLGRLNGEPVATAMVFFDGHTAGIYGVSTLPAFRRQGIGMRITHHALKQISKQGRTRVVLQATTMGESVYQHLGFLRDGGAFHTYSWNPKTH